MSISKEYLIQAQDELEKLRSANRRTEYLRHAEIIEKIPEYAKLEEKLSDTMANVVALVASKSSGCEEKIKAVSEENISIQNRMEQLLVENGYDKNYLGEIYSCEKCRDKGIIDGNWCGCLKKIAHRLAADDLNKRSPLKLCSFETFDLSLYSDAAKGESSPRDEMEQNFNICVNFADNFKGNEKGLLMTGGTGLGKTHLSLSVAKRIIQKDFSVVYCSVPELLRAINNEQFGRSDGNTMSVISSCDLLVLDDLGAENPTERDVSLLYEIINGRLCRSLPMIINTNLSAEKLNLRYSERLFSRLFSLEVLFFKGDDNRLKY